MLEVVFDDSTMGALCVAKNLSQAEMLNIAGEYRGEHADFFRAEFEKAFKGEAVGGNPEDVICIRHNLDIGDIAGAVDSEGRRREFRRLYGSVDFDDEEVAEHFSRQREYYERLLAAAENGEQIRAWTSNTPFSACGFAFMCDALRDIDCKLSVIHLPETWPNTDDTIVSHTDWGEISPGKFHSFLPLEREMSNIEKRRQSYIWNNLKAENAPLRAVVNGRLISVPEDFYDHIILKSISDGEFPMALLIGTTVGNYSLGVWDGWYALRIEKLIAENILAIVADGDPSHPYGKILRKVADI